MIRKLWNEQWKPIVFDSFVNETEIYKISNYGRLIRYREDKEVLFNPYVIHGYPYFKVKKKEKGKFKSYYLHKLVALHFIKKENEEATFVLHLDYDKSNNHANNLKWATRKEKEVHQFTNPNYKRPEGLTSAKLTENRVRLLKKILNDPNRKTRMKIIAKQFGITTQQLRRIRSGENWGHIPSL